MRLDGLRYYTFDSLADCGVTQAIFTRQGGVSPEPWAALNLGGTVGDDPQRVAENRLRAFQAVGRSSASLYDVWQVHGDEVVIANAPRPPHTPHLKADAMLTDRPEVTLFMRFADCVPDFVGRSPASCGWAGARWLERHRAAGGGSRSRGHASQIRQRPGGYPRRYWSFHRCPSLSYRA